MDLNPLHPDATGFTLFRGLPSGAGRAYSAVEVKRPAAELADERRQHSITDATIRRLSERNDELCAQLQLPPDGQRLPLPPVTITSHVEQED